MATDAPSREIVNLIEQVRPGANLKLFGNHCSGRDDWKYRDSV